MYRDFDALAAEKNPFAIKLGGREIVFPKTLAADTVLTLRREALGVDKSDEQAGVDFLLAMGERAMGEETFDYVMQNLGLAEVLDLLTDLMVYYGVSDGADDQDDDQGEGEGEGKSAPGETPDETAPTDPSDSTISSNTTGHLKPISSSFGLVPMPDSGTDRSTGDALSVG